ncbi:hypothetical protein GCM10010149_54010 [Nonomuraea roseoviolacea subsp. roseoviolacea]|uniref:hypothetical protein n=1 Tax=Nonomuraea roseoviolacea TaxID=103837 RepID=UPI0031D97603
MIRHNDAVRLLLRSIVAGSVVAALLLLLLHWPTSDSSSELKLMMAFALAPFPLSTVAALLARLPHWPVVGLMALLWALISTLLVEEVPEKAA